MRSSISLCLILVFLSLFAIPSICIETYKIEGRLVPNLSQLEPTTKIVLDGGKYSTLIRKNGKFKRKEKKTNDLILLSRDNVPPGSYLLEVSSRKFIYPKIRIDVDPRGVRPFVTITGSEWSYNGPALQYPLELSARSTADYFLAREGFSITSLFANPYIIMMGFSVVILFIMPKMMANLDQDALKELQENQAQNPLAEMPDISTTLANYLSDFLVEMVMLPRYS
ncbi:7233_t:CDS:2 [Funneliformis mosseae]|uniref:7233_t:CDS:1 n=1 Tax=Funneliformis mosseae TaxID=27381 RepID=A0A9N9ALU3_FUNMO|nr:7233_t:CDS:2 [Funneliformis mosseae]